MQNSYALLKIERDRYRADVENWIRRAREQHHAMKVWRGVALALGAALSVALAVLR